MLEPATTTTSPPTRRSSASLRARGRDVIGRCAAGWRALAGASIAAVVLACLIPSWTTLGTAASRVPAVAWLALAAALLASHALRALRLRVEWHRRAPIGWWGCLRLTLVHTAAGSLLPLRTGEASYPLMMAAHGIGLRASMTSLLWLRLQDATVLAAAALLLLVDAGGPARGLAAIGLLLCMGALAPLVLRRWGRIDGDGWPQELARAVVRGGAVGWILTLANWSLKLVALGTAMALLTGVPPAWGWAGAVGGEIAAVLPIQPPAGLGLVEAGHWFGVGLAARGAATPAAGEVLAGALLLHLFAISVTGLAAATAVGWPIPDRHRPR